MTYTLLVVLQHVVIYAVVMLGIISYTPPFTVQQINKSKTRIISFVSMRQRELFVPYWVPVDYTK